MSEWLEKQITEAMEHAKYLRATLGDDHPRTMMAIMNAVELADPGFCDRAMAECGIRLPEPTHCAADGKPVYLAGDVAGALDKPEAEVNEKMEELSDALGIKKGGVYQLQ